jgi:hypothetical protein
MPQVQARLKAQVQRRDAFRCEYRHFPERFGELRFQLDHIRAEQHADSTVLANLAWSCLRCNKHKGPNLSGIDPKTNRTVRLFHPRHDPWEEHFACQGSGKLSAKDELRLQHGKIYLRLRLAPSGLHRFSLTLSQSVGASPVGISELPFPYGNLLLQFFEFLFEPPLD